MSYDIYLGVRIHGTDKYAIIGEPSYNSPTYNLGEMFRACMDWDFDQGEWYKVVDVLPNIERGIHELAFNRKKYEKYIPSNGWGSIGSALKCLESIKTYIQHHVDGWEQEIPIEHLYIRW